MKQKTWLLKQYTNLGQTRFMIVVLVCAVLLILTGWFLIKSNISPEQQTTMLTSVQPVDLIKGQHWQMAGVEVKDLLGGPSRLRVSSKDLAIVEQDGSPRQQNAPVNLYGIRLQTTHDYSIKVKITNIGAGFEMSLYGKPPLIEDEFRAELATFTVSANKNLLTINLSDQSTGNEAENKTLSFAMKTEHDLEFTGSNGEIQVKVDGIELAKIPDHNIFDKGSIWFGFRAPATDTSFEVAELSAMGLNGGEVAVYDTRNVTVNRSQDGIQARAGVKKKDLKVGAAVALGPIVADADYVKLLGNFGAITTENAMKFQFIHPLEGNATDSFNFSDTDALVDFSRRNNLEIHGHALVFGEANPEWVQRVAKQSPNKLEKVMTEHITTIMSRYKGRIQSYDVINEPLADRGKAGEYGLRQHIWYQAMGKAYIVSALRAAHEADSAAQLWINEYGMESDDDRFNEMIRLVKWLQAQGVPLTGVGFQAHIDEGDTDSSDTHIDSEKLRQRFRILATLGLKARISELDVSNVTEMKVFADVFDACIAESNCNAITVWGVTDKYSSSARILSSGVYIPGTGLLWDRYLQPTSGLDAIKTILD